jgi:hypothetical protein
MSCEDQALAPTEVCIKWGCDKAPLVLLGRFWTCPRCGSSYGEHAKERS